MPNSVNFLVQSRCKSGHNWWVLSCPEPNQIALVLETDILKPLMQ